MAGWGERGCWAGAGEGTGAPAAWRKEDPVGPGDPAELQEESFVGTAASWAPEVLLGDTGGHPDIPAGRKGGRADHWVACGLSLRGTHGVLGVGLLPCVEDHQGDTQGHACCCCDYHSVHCQGGGASQRSPDHLKNKVDFIVKSQKHSRSPTEVHFNLRMGKCTLPSISNVCSMHNTQQKCSLN